MGRGVLTKRTRPWGGLFSGDWLRQALPWRVGGCPFVRSCMGRPHPLSEEYTVTRHHLGQYASALQGVARQQRASAVPYALGTWGRRPLQHGFCPCCRRPAGPTPGIPPLHLFPPVEGTGTRGHRCCGSAKIVPLCMHCRPPAPAMGVFCMACVSGGNDASGCQSLSL